MANKDYEKKYTKPDMRKKLKEEIKESDKGGKKGQWSARKSQLLVQEYKKKGGDYKKDKKDNQAKSLDEWTKQDWQTSSGKDRARKDGKTKRYLPKKVWDQLSNEEKEEAERKKEKASKKGNQYVAWTSAIKRAFREAGYSEDGSRLSKKDLEKKARKLGIEGRSKMSKDELKKAINNNQQSSLDKKSKAELYEMARKKDIDGRSKMDKDELLRSLTSS